MHRLIALYHHPQSEEAFRCHLMEVHLPLVQKFPGLRGLRYGFGAKTMAGASPYFAVVECDFDHEGALQAALGSPEGAAAARDVPNYAEAGVTIITFAVTDFNDGGGRQTQ